MTFLDSFLRDVERYSPIRKLRSWVRLVPDRNVVQIFCMTPSGWPRRCYELTEHEVALGVKGTWFYDVATALQEAASGCR